MKRLVEIDDTTHVVAPRTPTAEMINAGERTSCSDVMYPAPADAYAAMIAAAPPLCETCGDYGMVGGRSGQTPESYQEHGEPCPDCNVAPTLPDAQVVTDERAAFDGDSEESRFAFRQYDQRDPARGKTPWQIWRDACAWQARSALSAAAGDDTERLDFLIDERAFIAPIGDQFRLEWPYDYVEQPEIFSTPREAIDAAIAAASKGDAQ